MICQCSSQVLQRRAVSHLHANHGPESCACVSCDVCRIAAALTPPVILMQRLSAYCLLLTNNTKAMMPHMVHCLRPAFMWRASGLQMSLLPGQSASGHWQHQMRPALRLCVTLPPGVSPNSGSRAAPNFRTACSRHILVWQCCASLHLLESRCREPVQAARLLGVRCLPCCAICGQSYERLHPGAFG